MKVFNLYTGRNSIYKTVLEYYTKTSLDYVEVHSMDKLLEVNLNPFISKTKTVVYFLEKADNVSKALIEFILGHSDAPVFLIFVSMTYSAYDTLRKKVPIDKAYMGTYPNKKVFIKHYKKHVDSNADDTEILKLRSKLYGNYDSADQVFEMLRVKAITLKEISRILKRKTMFLGNIIDSILIREPLKEKEVVYFLNEYKYAYNYISKYSVKHIRDMYQYYIDYVNGTFRPDNYDLSDFQFERIEEVITKSSLYYMAYVERAFLGVKDRVTLMQVLVDLEVLN